MNKFNLKQIKWKETPKETFVTKVDGEEMEVTVRGLTGQELLDVQEMRERKCSNKDVLCYVISKALDIEHADALSVLDHDLLFASVVSEKSMSISSAFIEETREDKEKSLRTTELPPISKPQLSSSTPLKTGL